jgi:hypothetical protein
VESGVPDCFSSPFFLHLLVFGTQTYGILCNCANFQGQTDVMTWKPRILYCVAQMWCI